MELSQLYLPEKTVEYEVPGCPGFTISLTYLSKEEMQKLLKKCTHSKKRGSAFVDELNEDEFIEQYALRTIKGWSGFKIKHVKQFMLVNDDEDDDSEVEFNEKNAVFILKNSPAFEKLITEFSSEVENFTKPR